MKKNKKAFSLIIAIGLVLITTLLAFTILEYMVPFGRNIKGVENSTKSYYLANSGVERGLYFFSKRNGNQIKNDSSKAYGSTSSDFKFQTISVGNIVPPLGRGNSEYHSDWNKISIGDPIQLAIGYGSITNLSGLSISFRVPDLNGNSVNLNSLTTGTTPLINWQLLSDNNTLNSNSVSVFKRADINGLPISLSSRQGVLLNGTNQTFQTFFNNNNCGNSTTNCILKFSVINDLLAGSTVIPYIEWKINFCQGLSIACPNNGILRYSIIDTEGKSSGFIKSLNVKVPQETVSEAFDFTVFQ